MHAERNIIMANPSVCLFNAVTVSIRMDIIVTLLDDLVRVPPPSQNSKTNLLSGTLNIRGGESLHLSPFILETVRDKHTVTMEH